MSHMLWYLPEIQIKLFYLNAVVHTETKSSHSNETDQGEKNQSRSAKGGDQILTEEEQPLIQESVQMQVLNKSFCCGC